MKKHLTDLSVQRIKPPGVGQVEIFDLGYPGLALRVGNGGAKSFVLFFRREGKLRRVTLGRWPRITLAAARDAWRNVQEGKPIEAEARGELFSVAVEEWLRRDAAQRNKATSLRQMTLALELDVLPAWRGRKLTEIGKRDVLAVLDSIAERAPIKANRVRAYLARFFRWAVERDLISASPMAGLGRPVSEASRDRVLTDDELTKIWRATGDGVTGSAVRLLMLTGSRREEIGQLRWSEVRDGAIHLSNGRTKTGVPHVIPLSAEAQAVLDGVLHIADSDYVFTSDGTKAIAGWAKRKAALDAKCGVVDWRIHDLRRTVATGLQRLGVNLQTIEAVLGHVSGSRSGVVGVYQRHSFDTEKRAALQAWGAHVVALVEQKQ